MLARAFGETPACCRKRRSSCSQAKLAGRAGMFGTVIVWAIHLHLAGADVVRLRPLFSARVHGNGVTNREGTTCWNETGQINSRPGPVMNKILGFAGHAVVPAFESPSTYFSRRSRFCLIPPVGVVCSVLDALLTSALSLLETLAQKDQQLFRRSKA
jgi:hypothetical protein